MGKVIRIKKNREFQKIYRSGRFAVSKALTVYIHPNFFNINIIGISASKKYGKSVKRNRIRRLIRESYKLLNDSLKTGYDFVIVARRVEDTDDICFRQIYKELRFLMKRLNILEEK